MPLYRIFKNNLVPKDYNLHPKQKELIIYNTKNTKTLGFFT